MTNKEDDEKFAIDPMATAVQAIQLVGELLEEACLIAGRIKSSGDPWKYVISNLRKVEKYKCNLDFTYHISLNEDLMNNHQETPIITSTPQKGQGDEDFAELNHSEMMKSTSMYINHLFDMSDVDGTDENENDIQDSKEIYEKAVEDVKEILESCVEIVFGNVFQSKNENNFELSSKENSDISSYSFLSDITILDEIEYGIRFYMHDEEKKEIEEYREEKTKNIEEHNEINDVRTFENAYMTLNRDYEQYTEMEPAIRDSKGLSLEEIDLCSQPHLDVKSGSSESLTKKTELPTTSSITYMTNPRKRTLIRRCRLQGKRFFACLGTWWRKRMFTRKLKKSRIPGSFRGLSPLSPSTRRRTSSLLDERYTENHLQSSRWKFNTISETFLRSSIWKELGSKVNIKKHD